MLSPNVVTSLLSDGTPADPRWLAPIVNDDPEGWLDWLDSYPDLNTLDEQGMTPLHWACFLRRPRMANDLLALGADPWCADHDGAFPWQLAMRWPAHDGWAWDRWPERYPQAFARRDPRDPWHNACIGRAILNAAQRRRYDVMQAMIMEVDAQDCPGVLVAMPHHGDQWPWVLLPWAHAVVLLDLEHAFPLFQTWGINLDERDSDGRTAVQWAIALQYPTLADLLLNAGARLVDPEPGQAPLVLDEQAARPDPVSLAMVMSPAMAQWISQRLRPDGAERASRLSQDVWDTATRVHGAAAMMTAMVDSWKRRYRWNDSRPAA